MTAGSALILWDLLIYGAESRWDLIGRPTRLFQTLGISGDGFDGDRVAGVNSEHRLRGRPIISPGDGLRRDFQAEVGGGKERANGEKQEETRERAEFHESCLHNSERTAG